MSGSLRIASVSLNLINGATKTLPQKSGKLLLASTSQLVVPRASLISLARQKMEGCEFEKLEPFPYKTKTYTRLHVNLPFLDPTPVRFNNNTKIVVVDGNIGSKKEEFAKEFAAKFGMFYMPEPRMDDVYVNDDGFDYRTLNKYIHPKLHAIDERMFYENPMHEGVPWFKMLYYRLRFAQYIDALAHLFNTGQGVVLERSPHSDFVFTDAMFRCGFLPQDAFDYYFRLRYNTIHHLLRPHLIIYLNCDVDLLHKRIQDRNIPYLSNSKVLTKEYLNEIQTSYKKYLDNARINSEVLVYKYEEDDMDMDDVAYDVEKVNLDEWDCQKDKFCDWNLYVDSLYHEYRYRFTTGKASLICEFSNTLTYDVPSLDVDMHDFNHRNDVYKSFVKNYGMHTDSDKSIFGQIFNSLENPKLNNFLCRAPFY